MKFAIDHAHHYLIAIGQLQYAGECRTGSAIIRH